VIQLSIAGGVVVVVVVVVVVGVVVVVAEGVVVEGVVGAGEAASDVRITGLVVVVVGAMTQSGDPM
jgi:hypothetical protein